MHVQAVPVSNYELPDYKPRINRRNAYGYDPGRARAGGSIEPESRRNCVVVLKPAPGEHAYLAPTGGGIMEDLSYNY